MKHIKNIRVFLNENFEEFQGDFEDDDLVAPIGVSGDTLGINGLVCIFSPLETDMIDDWNNDEVIKDFVKQKRLFLTQDRYDEWSIFGIEGDKEVRSYVIKNYSW